MRVHGASVLFQIHRRSLEPVILMLWRRRPACLSRRPYPRLIGFVRHARHHIGGNLLRHSPPLELLHLLVRKYVTEPELSLQRVLVSLAN